MTVSLTPEKCSKGVQLCSELVSLAEAGTPIKAKTIMSVWGFLNFVVQVLRSGQPFVRELGICVGSAKVFAAWARGRRTYNPLVHLSSAALQDLRWWIHAPLATSAG